MKAHPSTCKCITCKNHHPLFLMNVWGTPPMGTLLWDYCSTKTLHKGNCHFNRPFVIWLFQMSEHIIHAWTVNSVNRLLRIQNTLQQHLKFPSMQTLHFTQLHHMQASSQVCQKNYSSASQMPDYLLVIKMQICKRNCWYMCFGKIDCPCMHVIMFPHLKLR